MAMTFSTVTEMPDGGACLVLMLKAPARSKRRIAGAIGRSADALAECLIACAGEDIQDWPGPALYAPASAGDAEWLARSGLPPRPAILQGNGNLGERIEQVSASALSNGHKRQVFIGIDCPQLTPDYIDAAAAALIDHDVVLGPAEDGGVVLMGVNGHWPPLGGLPWSSSSLFAELGDLCAETGRCWATLPTLNDVDSVEDLARVRQALADDRRRWRQALCRWIDTTTGVRREEQVSP